MFFTNGTYSSADLVTNLRRLFDLPFTRDHVVVAPSPCSALTDFHDKRVLVVCQDDSVGLINEYVVVYVVIVVVYEKLI